MDYTEIIEREALKYSEEKWKHPSSNLSRAHCSLDFEAGIKSNISKQITEIEVVNGKIELLEGLRIFYKGVDISDNNVIKKLMELEQLRDKLINELKLK